MYRDRLVGTSRGSVMHPCLSIRPPSRAAAKVAARPLSTHSARSTAAEHRQTQAIINDRHITDGAGPERSLPQEISPPSKAGPAATEVTRQRPPAYRAISPLVPASRKKTLFRNIKLRVEERHQIATDITADQGEQIKGAPTGQDQAARKTGKPLRGMRDDGVETGSRIPAGGA